jgi:FKBP-type peptidyl-prolyl cis-trans isomerase FklB
MANDRLNFINLLGDLIVKTPVVAVLIALVLSAAWVVAQETLPTGPGQPGPKQALPTDVRHYSYAIGQDLGSSFRENRIPLDLENLVAGVRDALQGKDPQYSAELCQAALERLSQKQVEALVRRGQEFLVANAKAQGVQTTPSGLQYKVLKSGNGSTPSATDRVNVHYRGQLVDGTVFDETYGGEPATLPVNGVIAGWSEALQQMKVGDKWQLAVPADLAYGEGGRDMIPPNATLIFDVELLGIEGK